MGMCAFAPVLDYIHYYKCDGAKDGGLRLSVKVGLDQVAPSKKAPFFR
jgi:hypothetical protein